MIHILLLLSGIALLIGTILLLFMYKEANSNRVIEMDFTFPNFPQSFDEMRIFFISDIHFRIIDEMLIKQVTGKVDFVVIGGDIMEKNVPYSNVERNLTLLQQLGSIYFVWGNNDYEGDPRRLLDLLLTKDVKILKNSALTLERGGQKLNLLGVDDAGLERDRIDLAIKNSDAGFRILISHNPIIVEKIKPEHQIDFVLSGHTHGGQIRLFGFGIAQRGGIKKYGQTIVLISNGYGTTGVPLRLGAKAETHLITLRSS